MTIGATLGDQIYAEGDSSWGLKYGFLDVESVAKCIEKIKEVVTNGCMGTSANCYKIKKAIDEEVGVKIVVLTDKDGEGK